MKDSDMYEGKNAWHRQEQSQRLLVEDTASNDVSAESHPHQIESSLSRDSPLLAQSARVRTLLILLIILIGFVITSFIVFAFFSGWSMSWTISWSLTAPTHSSEVPMNAPHSPSNYVLDPHWDFLAPSRRREYWWTIHDTELNPDGVYRPMILINEQFPGPVIECNEGDTIVVHINNLAVNATSFHWHGIYQNGTNWMDGTVGITQCPIAPQGKFTYEFQINGQSGTYWYHAHQGAQASDGLLGPLIVHSKEEHELQKLPYTTDTVVMVQDHYHDTSSGLLMQYLQSDRENVEPVPDGGLINGKNERNCDFFRHRKCDNSTASLSVFHLAPQQSHRLRFINVGSFAEFQIQIDEHQMALTEVDGTDVEPIYYHRLNISPGQRYSVVVSSNVTRAESFWMRARMVTACFGERNKDMEPEVRAIIQYSSDGESVEDATRTPESIDWNDVVELVCKDMITTELVPVKKIPAPTQANTSFYLRSNFEIGAWRLSRGFFNTSTWRPDVYSPSLGRVVNGYSTNNQSFTTNVTGVNTMAFNTAHELVLQVDGIQTIDIVIQNFDDGNHPLHLHGYKYFVLAQGHGYVPAGLYDSLDISNPLQRDTATVEAFGWILIRLVTDNPGMWAFHCHITWHTEAGLMMQLFTRPDVVARWSLPKGNNDLCKGEGLEKGTSPKDEIWYGHRE